MSDVQKEMINDLKVEWKKLWQERIDNRLRAEGIATEDYLNLFVDKGTIIHATRDFKALNFKEILEQHQIINAERFIEPGSSVGGWGKFIKTNITICRPQRSKRAQRYVPEEKQKQQPKKGGRGWLHQ